MLRQCWRRLAPAGPMPMHRTFSTLPATAAAAAAAQEDPAQSMTAAEASIANLLRDKLQPTELLVRDVSGGCGSMYAIDIASPVFRGVTMLKQQRMVNAALGDVVKNWHGLQLNTRVSESTSASDSAASSGS